MTQVLNGSVAELKAAVSLAKEGDVIEVAGDFADFGINGARFTKPGAGITIRPAPGLAHSFTLLSFQSLNGIHLRGLRVTGAVAMTAVKASSVKFCKIGGRQCADDEIRKLTSKAMDFLLCDGVEVIGNEISYTGYGISLRRNTNLTFRFNDTHHFRADAYRGYSSNLTISDNIVTDLFRDGGEHVDAIQLWTTGVLATEAPPHDITVERNFLCRNGGDPSQSIFINNERSLKVNRIFVRDNVAAMGQWNAIYVVKADTVEITGNTVVGWLGALSAGQQMTPWIKTTGSTNLTQSENVIMPLQVNGSLDGMTRLMRARRVAEVATLIAA